MRRISPRSFSLILLMLLIVSVPVFAAVRYTLLLKRTPIYKEVQSWGADQTFPGLTKYQAIQLKGGHKVDYHPHYSYVLYPKEKPENTVRIGIFGDSFVEGAEVAPGHEFPSLLQKKFDRSGITNVEVINFGLGGRGVSHMYLLWDYLGRDYDLDYVVFFPFDFHKDRDESFCNFCTHEMVHARFILQDDGLRLIPLVGDSMKEAIETYHSFFTPWRYIRYDNRMPMFLKVFLPESLQNRTNPFYYRLRIFNRGEVLEIYRRLFDDLAKQVKNLVIIANDDEIFSLKEKMEVDRVNFLRSQVQFVNSLYYAPKWHNSAIGGDLRSAELYSWFMGRKKPDLNVVEFLPGRVSENDMESRQPLPLYEYQEVQASLGSYLVADFVTGVNNHYYQGAGEKYDFQDHRTESLLAITSGVDFIRFLPLDFRLKENTPVAIHFNLNGTAVTVPMGVLDGSSGVIGRLRLGQDDEPVKRGESWSLQVQNGQVKLEGKGSLKDVILTIGNREVLKARLSGNADVLGGTTTFPLEPKNFSPIQGEWIYIRVNPGNYVDVETMNKKNGTLDLVLKSKDGRSDRYPILPYTITRLQPSEFDPPISSSIAPHP